nr:DUF898 family protein [Glaciecola sp. MH2013]
MPVYIVFIGIGLLIAAYLTARVRNYIYEQTVLDGNIRFKSSLSARGLAMLMFTNLLIVIFTLGLGTPWVKVRLARYYANNTLVAADVDLSEFVSIKQQEQSSLGEQIGDAFDVDIGITL